MILTARKCHESSRTFPDSFDMFLDTLSFLLMRVRERELIIFFEL